MESIDGRSGRKRSNEYDDKLVWKISMLSVFFVQLGDTLATIATMGIPSV